MNTDDCIVFYMTAVDLNEAEKIAGLLIKEKLAACINILGEIKSFYEWNGKVQNSNEVAFIAKTTKGLSKKFIDFVQNIHSYDTPCIISFKIDDGNDAFLSWISGGVM